VLLVNRYVCVTILIVNIVFLCVYNNSNNNLICIAPYGRDFRGANIGKCMGSFIVGILFFFVSLF